MSLLFFCSIDTFICGTSYQAAGKKIPIINIIIISGISALAYLIAFCAGSLAFSTVNIAIAETIGRVFFILLGLWVIFTSFRKPPNFTPKEMSFTEVLIISIAVASDAFIVGMTLSVFGGSVWWFVNLWLIGFLFFVLGQITGQLVKGIAQVKLAPIVQGIFFLLWGVVFF